MDAPATRLRDRREPRLTYFPLVLSACAALLGIVLDRWVAASLQVWLGASAVSLTLWLWLWLARYERAASCCVLAGIVAAAAGWHHAYWRLYPASDISRCAGELARPCCVEAVALTSPRWIPEPAASPLRTTPARERCELLVRVKAIRRGPNMQPASGRAELTIAGLVNDIRAGDRLKVYAHLQRSGEPLNPGEFDFGSHQRIERTNCRLFADFRECVELVESGSSWRPRRWLANVRAEGVEILRRHISPQRARLAAAILLGAREQLDPDQNEDYLVTGTVHILSISGLHVGILASAFFLLLNTGLLSRRTALAATVTFTFAYATLTDLQPPVVRAAILVAGTCLALWHGRLAEGMNTLGLALVVVLVWNPASVFQVGTQLSFLAVAMMIANSRLLTKRFIEDPLDRLIASTRPWPQRALRKLADAVWRLWLTGALIWLVSSPLVWRHYHLISPVALALNVVIWLPIALVMYSGFATLVLGGLVPLVGRCCGQLCDACLALVEWLIHIGRDWPASYFWLAAPPWWWVIGFYFAVVAMLLVPPLRLPRRWASAAYVSWTFVALLLVTNPVEWPRSRPLACHFTAVGHGLGVLIELPDGRNMLYDAGRLGSPLGAVRPVAAVLWSQGVSHLDAVIISHADADHFNGIPGLLERFSVGTIYVSPVMFEGDGLAVEALHAAIASAGVPMKTIQGGQSLDAGPGSRIEVLHPPRKGVYGSNNANSIVLLIESAGRRVLLAGDLESPGLEDVLAEEPLDCDVVLAPHHGSPRSSPGRFADWCRPEHVIISGGRAIDDARTVAAVRDSFRLRGAEVYHTADDGCITAIINPAGIKISTHRPHVRAVFEGASGGNLLQSE